MKMNKVVLCGFGVLCVGLFASCVSTQPQYGDASEARVLGMGVGSYDLQQNTIVMVDSLLANPCWTASWLSSSPARRRPFR